ncbi:MAG: redox-sensing transcriptional repressor Rex, partial [Lachnospiraceae bacterium]
KGIFDANPKMTGLRMMGIEIQDIDNMESFLQGNDIDIAMICVPRINAQKVCDILVAGGVKGIWNFAPVDLVVPEDVIVENVHLSESLLTLIYLLHKGEE